MFPSPGVGCVIISSKDFFIVRRSSASVLDESEAQQRQQRPTNNGLRLQAWIHGPPLRITFLAQTDDPSIPIARSYF